MIIYEKLKLLSIPQKIQGGFIFGFSIILIIGVLGIYYQFSTQKDITLIYNNNFLPVAKISNVLILSEKIDQ